MKKWKIECPDCGTDLVLPDDCAGQKVRCDLCKAVFVAGGAVPTVQPEEDDDDRPRRRDRD